LTSKTNTGQLVARRPISGLRWWIGVVLFASTVINYIDRQSLSLLAPYLKIDFHWTNSDYAVIVVAFRIAYSLGQTAFGRITDRIGTRRGLSLTVALYSAISILSSLARGFYSFVTFRALLGAGESGNWPGATKAVSEWFPKRERALATALFDSGASVGGAIAAWLVLWIYFHLGWHVAFAIPGCLGFLWLIVWRLVYRPPAVHPRISESERRLILTDLEDSSATDMKRETLTWRVLLGLPQSWAVIVSKGLIDPIWFFVTAWFPIYLVTKGVALKAGLAAVWIPFLAADLGNFFGGWASSALIKRGWPLGRARKAVVVFGGVGMTLLVPTVHTNNPAALATLFALATFCYAAFSTMTNVLPSDMFYSESVATVSGMGGTAAGLGTVIASLLIGRLSDERSAMGAASFDPIVIVAGLVPLVAMGLTLVLARNTEATRQGLVRTL
jgi:MFS transporter, ACS family, hexuronate transporter